ncbi:MAG: zinc ribbon domain-containing protein [Nitrospinae bacterium]|nr:zinc ribbon domain-containing protein [Nitrospinota bacterium]
MPIYEFVCKECGNSFEMLSLSSAGFKKVECTKCGGKKVSKMMSTFAPAIAQNSSSHACRDEGSCGVPGAGCGGGMCGLN